MSKIFLSGVLFCLVMMAHPVFVLADVASSQIQQAVSQTDMSRQARESKIPEEQKNAEINVKKEKEAPVPEGPAFLVKQIELEGNTLFSTEKLRVYAKPYEGRMLHLKDLQDLANKISAYYQRVGYITSRAYIPPQRIIDGKVVIRIVEGRVGNISIKGNHYFAGRIYLHMINVTPGEPFNVQPLALSVQDINQQPDRAVKAYIEPGQEPGTSDIVLVAQDQNYVHASYEYNTNGTKLTHLYRDLVHFTDNNLTGHGDSLQTTYSTTVGNELQSGLLQYIFPVPLQGLTYSFNAGGAYSRLGGDLLPLKVTADSYFISPGVTKNFIKGPSFKLDGFMDFEIKDSKTLVDTRKLSYDRDRVLDIGPRASINDSMGETFLAEDMRVGIPDLFGGGELHDPDASRYKSGGEFIYWTGSVDRINRLPLENILVLHGSGQYSPMPLNSLEQMDLGGMDSVRGYLESDSSGDSGLNFSAEIRTPLYFIPRGWHVGTSHDKTWRDSLSLVSFIDGGRTFNYYRQNASGSLDRTLLSAGVGLRFYITPDMNAQAGIGFPFGDAPTSGNKHEQVYILARVGF